MDQSQDKHTLAWRMCVLMYSFLLAYSQPASPHPSLSVSLVAPQCFPYTACVSWQDFWDTAGQERFSSMHPSYYYRAHACVLVFDVTRKITYKNLTDWYGELRQYCEGIPCLLVANKIDVDYNVSIVHRKQHVLLIILMSAALSAIVSKRRWSRGGTCFYIRSESTVCIRYFCAQKYQGRIYLEHIRAASTQECTREHTTVDCGRFRLRERQYQE